MTFAFTCEYIGTNYCGFQRQKNGPSIQAELESALSKILCEPIKIVGSGRTDAGVHAVGQVCSFKTSDLSKVVNLEKIEFGVNGLLPMDIAIRELRVVNEGFNARFDARSKQYIYKCYVSRLRSPVLDNSGVLHLHKMPDVAAMQRAAEFLSGTHDFTSFSSIKTSIEEKVRTIKIDIVADENRVTFYFVGNGFLRNMVRILVGTLLEIGEGKRKPEDVVTILRAKDRKVAGQTAPAHGLWLQYVEY